MHKHETIIKRLSTKQKIALLTNIGTLSLPEFTELGIPYVSVRTVEDMLRETGEGITANTLARSWDATLIERLTAELTARAKATGTNFVITPSPKIKLDPYSSAISEDPRLSGYLAGAYVSAVHGEKIPACLAGFKLNAEDVAHLDKEPSKRIIEEYLVTPFRIAASLGESHSVMASVTGPGAGWGDLNLRLMLSAEKGLFPVNMNVLCDEHTPEATAEVWHAGGIVMEGTASVLEFAYEKYQHISEAIKEGHATLSDLEEAYADGSAINDEMLDAAVLRVIDFAFACESEQGAHFETPDPEAAPREMPLSENLLSAIRESVVLLKNERRTLPLKGTARVAVIGDAAVRDESFMSELRASLGDSLVGTARGYAYNEDRSELLIGEALELANEADILLLFLGIDEKRLRSLSASKRLELPANQLALVDALSEAHGKTVAIIDGDVLPGMNFDTKMPAVLLAPAVGRASARALSEILYGESSPSGKLTESLYDSPSETVSAKKRQKDSGRNKVGPFIGYRHSDSSGIKVKYPFGHGLSYTNFVYSGFSANGNEISFTVRNAGKFHASEIAEIYVGKKDSEYIRPAKELKGFAKVELAPGRTARVRLKIEELGVYDEAKREYLIENGNYEIYVGTSLDAIKLRGVIRVGMAPATPRKPVERRSDYLQSISNVVSDKYTLEAEYRKMKRNLSFRILYILTIILAVLINVGANALMLLSEDVMLIFGASISAMLTNFNIVALVLVALLILFDVIAGKRYKKKCKKDAEERSNALFEGSTVPEGFDASELFVKEFDETASAESGGRRRRGAEYEDYSMFVDNDLTLPVAVSEMAEYSRSLGLSLSEEAPAAILSSLAASRLVLVNSLEEEALKKFTDMLSGYLGSPVFHYDASEPYADGALLYAPNGDGYVSETEVMRAVYSARDNKNVAHIVTVTGMRCEDMPALLSPYIRYFGNPERGAKISPKGQNTVALPENLWFIVSLRNGERTKDIPVYLTELLSVLPIGFAECEPEGEGKHGNMGYYQIKHLLERAKQKFEMPEELWKKVDAVEEYVHKRASYSFGNKLWLRMEKYLSVFTACEQEMQTSLDNAICANILSVIDTSLSGRLEEDDRGIIETLEFIFGEDSVPVCRKSLKDSAALAAREPKKPDTVASEPEPRAEEAVEAIEEATEEAVEEAAEEATETIEEAADEAVEATEEVTEEAAEEVAEPAPEAVAEAQEEAENADGSANEV